MLKAGQIVETPDGRLWRVESVDNMGATIRTLKGYGRIKTVDHTGHDVEYRVNISTETTEAWCNTCKRALRKGDIVCHKDHPPTEAERSSWEQPRTLLVSSRSVLRTWEEGKK
jgi:hypothetical protein